LENQVCQTENKTITKEKQGFNRNSFL